MPILTTSTMALRFKENWLAKNPDSDDISECGSSGSLDDSLTSLNWLQNLSLMKIQPAPDSPAPLSLPDSNLMNPMTTVSIHCASPEDVSKPTPEESKMVERTHAAANTGLEKIDYKTNPYVKPPYSYATLICMAMKDTKKSKITLSSIYKWIQDNFMYYKVADPSWQNSIRHNLSLNKCFTKVPRKKDEPGKGGFWKLDPEHADLLENGIFKKRRSERENIACITTKKLKREDYDNTHTSSKDQNSKHNRKQISPKRRTTSAIVNSSQPKIRTTNSKLTHLSLAEHDEHLDGTLKEEFCWNSVFDTEIDVDGIKIKTEEIINQNQSRLDSPFDFSDFSPPSSVDGVDDVFNTNSDNSRPTDKEAKSDEIDLKIQGVHITQPEWFLEQPVLSPSQFVEENLLSNNFPPSPANSLGDTIHPWAETDLRNTNSTESFEHFLDFDNNPNETFKNF